MSADPFAAAQSVADATLYEGYVLYPYRASSTKNQFRWQFGVLVPEAHGTDGERAQLRTECVVDPGDRPELRVRVRFLQVQQRAVEMLEGDDFRPVAELVVDSVRWVHWDEAVEQQIDLGPFPLLPLAGAAHSIDIDLGAHTEHELLTGASGAIEGRVVRTRSALTGSIDVITEWAAGPGALLKVGVVVRNATPVHLPGAPRDALLSHSLVGVHTLLAVEDATFVSCMDPPADACEAVAECHNDGTYPVLVGDDDRVMLSSPIILYDHPVIAPESHGDLYDSLEIDEILALRVLTLTDDEKDEARRTDPRAAAIVDRCDGMEADDFEQLHGIVRSIAQMTQPAASGPTDPTAEQPWWDPDVDGSFDPWTDTVLVGEHLVGKGARVVLRPSHRADAQDFFLDGLEASVAGVFHDVDGTVHIAVSVGDPEDEVDFAWQGRHHFFAPDEIEVLSVAPRQRAQ